MSFLSQINIWSSDLKNQLKVIFLQDKILIIFLLLNLLLNFSLYFIIYQLLSSGMEMVVLHYTVYFGIDFIGSKVEAYLMPIAGSLILLINLSLTLFFYKKEKIISFILTGVCFMVELLLMLGGGLLIWINR